MKQIIVLLIFISSLMSCSGNRTSLYSEWNEDSHIPIFQELDKDAIYSVEIDPSAGAIQSSRPLYNMRRCDTIGVFIEPTGEKTYQKNYQLSCQKIRTPHLQFAYLKWSGDTYRIPIITFRRQEGTILTTLENISYDQVSGQLILVEQDDHPAVPYYHSKR